LTDLADLQSYLGHLQVVAAQTTIGVASQQIGGTGGEPLWLCCFCARPSCANAVISGYVVGLWVICLYANIHCIWTHGLQQSPSSQKPLHHGLLSRYLNSYQFFCECHFKVCTGATYFYVGRVKSSR